MEKLISYMQFSKLELAKVIFPTKLQIRNAFFAVIIVVTAVSLYLGLVDLLMSLILKAVI